MDKLYRRIQILDLLKREAVGTQSEMCEKLARRGIQVTQATVSRDIEELGLIKTRKGYRMPGPPVPPKSPQPALPVILKEFLWEVRKASNLVVIKTHPGNAHSVAAALDAEQWPEVVGTVAGDDTIFLATGGAQEAARIRRKILDLVGQ
ncbi:MAG: ArgR family transcriptional regulator [Acidobacteria bacterium]|nr:MAG: ArgR family transcriptional regulator [Acidobacteriota bacterium]